MASRRVSILIAAHGRYQQEILRGIGRYVRASRRPWQIHWPQGVDPKTVAGAEAFRPDGILSSSSPLELVEQMRRWGKPLLAVTGDARSGGPWVGVANREVGALVARHFLEWGYRNFAFVGTMHHPFAQKRRDGFSTAVGERGFAVQTLNVADLTLEVSDWQGRRHEGLARWATALPKPCAVMAANDERGWELLQACRSAGVRVPEDLAVVGVDDDPVAATMADPPLSSVPLPAEQVGYEAAALLERLMDGEPVPPRPVLLEPSAVITRRSSDAVAIEDADVAAAVRFIYQNRDRPLGVEDVVAAVHVSRRVLENRFRRWLNRSPLQEIRRAQVERAKELLAWTDLPMPLIARRSGFSNAKHLSVAFHQSAGETPGDYRKRAKKAIV